MNTARRCLTAGIALVVGAMVAAGVTSMTAAASPTAPASPDPARALAAQQASEYVASRPASLNISPGEAFQQGAVVTSDSTQYVPYERTYAGIPVVGGDFVLVIEIGRASCRERV